MNRSSSRFQSNHQRVYFCRNTIISKGAKNSRPPIPAATPVVLPLFHCPNPPDTLPNTIKMGMAMITRKNEVSRSRGRSGYSTENCTGYIACSIAHSFQKPHADLTLQGHDTRVMCHGNE